MMLVATAMLGQPLAAQFKSDGFKFLEAVKKRDGTEVSELLDQPGSTLINARDITSGEGALHIVAQRRDVTWLRFLLGKGANPNIADKKGVTPLQIAAQLGLVEGVEALIDAGAQVEVANNSGETPLISAVHRRDLAMVRLLVSKGAKIRRNDNSGRSALDYAGLMGQGSTMKAELERLERDQTTKVKSYGPN